MMKQSPSGGLARTKSRAKTTQLVWSRLPANIGIRFNALSRASGTRRQKADFVHFCEVAAGTEFV
jgi:hypothetical protein